MNSEELIRNMQSDKCFHWVFPIDLIPKKYFHKRPFSMIINLDPHDKKGSHWIAIYVDENKADYFDSFGFPFIPKDVIEFFRINKIQKVERNKYFLQNITSDACGAYCILFLQMRCNNFKLKDFLALFNENLEQNDILATSFIN